MNSDVIKNNSDGISKNSYKFYINQFLAKNIYFLDIWEQYHSANLAN